MADEKNWIVNVTINDGEFYSKLETPRKEHAFGYAAGVRKSRRIHPRGTSLRLKVTDPQGREVSWHEIERMYRQMQSRRGVS